MLEPGDLGVGCLLQPRRIGFSPEMVQPKDLACVLALVGECTFKGRVAGGGTTQCDLEDVALLVDLFDRGSSQQHLLSVDNRGGGLAVCAAQLHDRELIVSERQDDKLPGPVQLGVVGPGRPQGARAHSQNQIARW